MGDNTAIEWTDATWTPIRARAVESKRVGWHCQHVSEGCRNCYAETMNRRLGTGLDYKPGHLRDQVAIVLDEKLLLAPLRWKRPRKIFVCSMTDLFADFVPDEMIDRMFAVMALCPQHVFQVLTKRPERMRAYLLAASLERWAGACVPGTLPITQSDVNRRLGVWPKFSYDPPTPVLPLPNVWLGVSVEDQAAADARIPELLATPAAKRFLSCEPLLGPVDLRRLHYDGMTNVDALTGDHGVTLPLKGRGAHIDWVIVGGESGASARPMHPNWARGLRDQCAAAGVPFLFKQWGQCLPAGQLNGKRVLWNPSCGSPMRGTKELAGRFLDGVTHDGMPS